MEMMKKQMLDTLKLLKEEYGIVAVKAEFEAEGSRTDELILLNEVVYRANMDLVIKIGGCEAVRDLDQTRLLGASGVMAPMIETPFAMKKFCEAANRVYGEDKSQIEWIINTETKTCYENFDAILEAGKGFVNTIAIGRVDLSSSMGLSRKDINTSEQLYEVCADFARRARAAGLRVGMGGGISMDAIPFISQIAPLLDKFESRKIVFRVEKDEAKLRAAILKAMEFETLYLKFKGAFYNRMAQEDAQRIQMMEDRIQIAYTQE